MERFTLYMAVEDYLKQVLKQWLISEWASRWVGFVRKGEGVTALEKVILSSWDSEYQHAWAEAEWLVSSVV